jgi:TonB family protein
MLKKSFTQKMKLSKTKPLKIEAVKTISSTSENGYQVDITPWQMEEEIVQLRVAVKKGGELFFNTDISSPMDKSVVIGRMIGETNKALLVTSSVVEEKDSSIISSLDNAESTFIPELNKPVQMDSKPVPLDYIHPLYPKSAKSDGVEGTVWLRVLVSENGDVVDAVVLKSLRKDLDKAALENAWEIKYQPAISQGKPIPVWIVYSITFKLN